MRGNRASSQGISRGLDDLQKIVESGLEETPSRNKVLPPFRRKQTYPLVDNRRSRKHRLAEERSFQIERQNNQLYQKLRKIKLKGKHESEKTISVAPVLPVADNFKYNIQYQQDRSKPMSFPPLSMQNSRQASRRPDLQSILKDREVYAKRYFQDILEESEKEKKLTEHLGDFECFGWKVKVVMINHEHIILKGQRGRQAITKKYVYEKVKAKVETGLEAWVSSKLQFVE